ncbi:MAG: FkbM family methyltransferase [Candidatus Bathyarchaeota archaeon]|uniref:FkbM family methyltransferase n=1 Tax=Candidatus Bathycorpusculum sp. TaxID=2994959 RepID=UPI0028191E72|nr:FkbM family methyltransferase [Candidatus Termiticorpusculum sp.]MCL2291482.1 FkbM family methyltransferase [Candidatus Termiticorpusculum sp.]
MVNALIKKLYRKFVPSTVRTKIRWITHRKELNASKAHIECQETYFKAHMDEFRIDDTRKTDILRNFALLKKKGKTGFPEMNTTTYEKYFTRELKIEKDLHTGLFYVLIDNKKLFYKKNTDEKLINHSFNSVSIEQDYTSPHRYLTNDQYFVGVMKIDPKQVNMDNYESFGVNDGDVVVDGGAAEGNFALSVVEKASKVYIIENDANWCEALKQTFSPYKEKVEIIQKCLSNVTDSNNITLADLIKTYHIDKIDFLKMDIEGYEKQALKGGITDNTKFSNIKKMAICVYHTPEDEKEISNFVTHYGYKFYLTDGYIYFPDSKNPPIRKAVLRAHI